MEGFKIRLVSVNGDILVFNNVKVARIFRANADRAHLQIDHEGSIVPCSLPVGDEKLRRSGGYSSDRD